MSQSFNNVILVGRLTKDPELKTTNSGKNVCSFTLAVDKGFGREGTNFIDCDSWNKTAEYVSRYQSKGSLLLVRGRLDQQTWEKDGQKRSRLSVVADEVQSLGSLKEAEPAPTNPTDDDLNNISLSEIPF